MNAARGGDIHSSNDIELSVKQIDNCRIVRYKGVFFERTLHIIVVILAQRRQLVEQRQW